MIGFIGQGFIGGNMADEFEKRGYEVVRFSKTKFAQNKEKLKECDFVFVAVPTPTINRKFDDSILIEAIENTCPKQKIIIKSTVAPGTTRKLQELYPDRYFFHSAEFLTEKNAKKDVENPTRNVVGCTEESYKYIREVMNLLPPCEHNFMVSAEESEVGKYMSNFLLTIKLLGANIIYDICQKIGGDKIDYDMVKQIAGTDPRIGMSHLDVDMDGGRGATGHCFPKDMAALTEFYGVTSCFGNLLLEALKNYNNSLAVKTHKDVDLLKEIYGLE